MAGQLRSCRPFRAKVPGRTRSSVSRVASKAGIDIGTGPGACESAPRPASSLEGFDSPRVRREHRGIQTNDPV